MHLLVGESVYVKYAHLFDDGRLAGFGGAQQQDLDGGVLEIRLHILDHVMLMIQLLALILPRRLLWIAQTAQKSAMQTNGNICLDLLL